MRMSWQAGEWRWCVLSGGDAILFGGTALGLFCSVWASLVVEHRFQSELASLAVAYGLSCPVACGIFVPGPGIKPMSPAFEGRFLTTQPPVSKLEQGDELCILKWLVLY